MNMSAVAVATYLRTLRSAAGLSQEEAAAKAGISAKTLGRWERGAGDHEPTVTNLKKLVHVLGGSVRDALLLLITEDATEDDGDGVAQTWLDLPAGERAQVDSIIENTMSEELLEIIQELRSDYQDDRTLVEFLRGALLGVAPAPAPTPASSVEERLRSLEALRTKRVITDAEYAARRQQLIESI